MVCTVLFVLVNFAAVVDVRASPYPVGDPRNCLPDLKDSGLRFDVLPGRGWDNLKNTDQSSVLAFNYSQCRTTYDRQYLLPDGMTAIPKLESSIDTHVQFFTHALNYTSTTSSSVNFDVNVFSFISGKYSSEYNSFRQRFTSDVSGMVRVQLKHHSYVIKVHMPAQLDPSFRNRVLQIAASVQSNDTDMATYLSQLLVRDYGTHYIHTMHIGALLVKEDFLRQEKTQNSDNFQNSVSKGVGFDFSKFLNDSLSVNWDFTDSSGTWNDERYTRLVKSTSVKAIGGPVFTHNMTAAEWEAGVDSAMVAIDRDGDPIHFMISSDNIPDLPPMLVTTTAEYVKNASDKYYEVNTYRGCTDPSSDNFNAYANIDNGACNSSSDQFFFGGVFQTCTLVRGRDNFCNLIKQMNPLTGFTSCPKGFSAVLLQSKQEDRSTPKTYCQKHYRHCGFLWLSRCTTGRTCEQRIQVSTVSYKTYWCVHDGTSEPEQKYFFGGTYTERTPNHVIGTIGCPVSFQPVRLTSRGHVCVSSDVDLGKPHSVPFGGFYSCKYGNPLARRNGSSIFTPDPKGCPEGFTQHLALADASCDINYCLRVGALSGVHLSLVKDPPFMDRPKDIFNGTQSYLFTSDGSVMVKNSTSGVGADEWSVYKPGSAGYSSIVENANEVVTMESDDFTSENTEGLSEGAIGAIVLAVFVAVSLLANVGLVVYLVRHRKKKPGSQYPNLES